MKAIAVIPARLASTRLPRKMLREIAGKPLIGVVYEAVRSSPLARGSHRRHRLRRDHAGLPRTWLEGADDFASASQRHRARARESRAARRPTSTSTSRATSLSCAPSTSRLCCKSWKILPLQVGTLMTPAARRRHPESERRESGDRSRADARFTSPAPRFLSIATARGRATSSTWVSTPIANPRWTGS